MVSELDGGQPPSPVSLPPGAAPMEAPHPAGTVSVARPPAGLPPRPPSPAAAPQLLEETEDMQVDSDAAAPSRSSSPTPRGASPMVPIHELGGAPHQQQQQKQQAQPAAALEPRPLPPLAQQQPQQPDEQQPDKQQQEEQQGEPAAARGSSPSPGSSSLGEELGGHPGRPASATGYESGDDMDMLAMRHCTNCTGTLWGHICMVRARG